jgi:hypothetical protein
MQMTRCGQLEAKLITTRMLRGNYVSDIQGRFVIGKFDLMLLYHHLVEAGVQAGMGLWNIYKQTGKEASSYSSMQTHIHTHTHKHVCIFNKA